MSYTSGIYSGKTHEHETEVIDKEGKILYFQCTANVALKDKAGKPIAVIEISKDISERKRSEEALRESETKYRSLMNNASDGILLTDFEGNISLQRRL